MKVVTRIDIAREVVEWCRDHPGVTAPEFVVRLRAIPADQIAPEIVDAACGWTRTSITCDECSASVNAVVEIREEFDTAQVCELCLLKALEMIERAQP